MTDARGMEEALRLVADHPHADTRIHCLCEPLGDVAAALVRAHPAPDLVRKDEVAVLYARLLAMADPEDRDPNLSLGRGFALGSLVAKVTRTRMEMSTSGAAAPGSFTFTAEHSARVPGLHQALPRDDEAAGRALEAVRIELDALGHDHLATDLRIESRKDEPIRNVTIVRPAPEDPEETDRHHGAFGHASDWAAARLARGIAEAIVRRWERRHEIRARLDQVADEARTMIDGVPEMTVEKTSIPMYSKPGYDDGYDVHVHLRMLGNSLRHEVKAAFWSRREEDRLQMTLRIREHRKRLAIRGDRRPDAETGDSELGIAPILAAAILAADPRYAAGILEEIEAEMSGRHMRPRNPRKRGITDITVRDGRVNACVDVTPEIRYEKDRVTLRTLPSVPDTLLNGIRGIAMRRLVDHPAFEGLTARSATISRISRTVVREDGTRGVASIPCVKIRPEQQSVPLGPVLEHLRRVVAAGAPSAPAPARRRRPTT